MNILFGILKVYNFKGLSSHDMDLAFDDIHG